MNNRQNESPEGMPPGYLQEEMQFIAANAVIPQQKMAELIKEENPGIKARDGSICFFKRNELKLLTNLLNDDEQQQLLLPILIEVVPGENYMAVITHGEIELKIVEHILGMPMRNDRGRIKLEKAQLAVVRQNLRTTTHYVFSAKTPSA